MTRHGLLGALFLAFLLFLSACGARQAGNSTFSGGQETPFLPPTLPASTPVPATLPAATLPPRGPTSTPRCTDKLTYQTDLTIPDGTRTQPGAILDKRWQVQNSGDCNWDARYRLKLVGGEALGASVEQALYPARSGTPAILRILFTAPSEPGSYRSAWQAYNPQGEAFGDLVFIDIVVETAAP